ncbi:hypothetical protein C0Q70_10840 [Pomacea canaliculata]|uniref:Hyaluronidase n=1 Tax=Pomacea canaliculata TaxID=400727 RepID=A0A2T7P4C7_POMCA|nr:hyaluronidase conohyal-Cn1-like isoform X2 [Pomacea canaliculata]PVD28253.1 hypothetical protein C0Q70_10840 [Pomacea canaliculata]
MTVCLPPVPMSLVISFVFTIASMATSTTGLGGHPGFEEFVRKPQLKSHNHTENTDLPPCSESLAEYDRPFRVIWNHPVNCDTKDNPMNFEDYGIDFNHGMHFMGDKIKLYYYSGNWPEYHGNTPVHGGLPQTLDPQHYVTTRNDFMTSRGSGNFTGLAIIDYEGWRPIFTTNYGGLWVYQFKSIDRVRAMHPEYNQTMVREEAIREFEAGAREIFQKTLAIGQEVMPHGFWGYYNYPRFWTNARSTIDINNRLAWLWKQADVLLPSIYLWGSANISREAKERVVRNAVGEAVRIQQTFSRPNTPIYPYSWNQRGSYDFYSKEDLDATLRLSADLGASGVVLWGSSLYYRAHNQCQRLRQYVHDLLGPYVRNLTVFMETCSSQLCAKHGRCVRKDVDKTSVVNSLNTSVPMNFEDYHCRCYAPWSGPDCGTRHSVDCQPHSSGHGRTPISG